METSPAVDQIRAKPVVGGPLRIRFVFKKPKEVVVLQENPVCSTSGTDRLNETSISVSGSKVCNSDENMLSTSLESDKSAIPSVSKKRRKHKTSKASLYNTMFDEWVPPHCLSLKEDENNNDDWRFSTKRQENASSMKILSRMMKTQLWTYRLQKTLPFTLERSFYLKSECFHYPILSRFRSLYCFVRHHK